MSAETDDIELAQWLNGIGSSRQRSETPADDPGATKTIYGTATSDSNNGTVYVDLEGTTVSGSGEQSVPLTTTCPVKKGQKVIITLVNNDPVVTGVAGWGDEANQKIAAAEAIAKAAIQAVDVEYALGESQTTPPESGWSTTAPEWREGMYMWQRTVAYTSEGASYSDPTCIQGAAGKDGEDGEKGDTGIGVKSVVEQYYLSTSNTAQSGGSWSTNQPEWSEGKYIWTRSQVTWTNNAVTTTTPVLAKAINSANETAARTAWYFWSDSEGAHVATTKGNAKTGNNILITGSNIELRDGEAVLATFNKSLIELGKNSPSAVIKLCNELGEIGVVTTAASSMLALFGANVGVKGNESATLASSGSHATAIGNNLMLSANNTLVLESSTIAVGKKGSNTTVISPSGDFTCVYEPSSGALSVFATSIMLGNSAGSDRGFGITSDNAFRVTTPYVSVGTDDLVPVSYVSHALEPVELFTTDSVVMNKNITLSETAANFQQLDVWFETDDRAQGFVSVIDPDQKIFTATTNFYQGQNMYVKSKSFFVNGTDVDTYRDGAFKTGIWSSDGMNAFGDYIGIKRVVGWRKRY